MRTEQWAGGRPPGPPFPADLVLAFGDRAALDAGGPLAALAETYPGARVVGCASGGEILGPATTAGDLAVTAVAFAHTAVLAASVALADDETSEASGRRLARRLPPEHARGPLAHVLVFADGVALNGSDFVRGVESGLPAGVAVTGGLAADGDRFERTPLWADGPLGGPGAVAVGLYGGRLAVGHGAVGGWDPFGPDRLVTRSEGHVLHTLDGRPALDLYRRYLGPYADALPASGLRFPLAVRRDGAPPVIRTLLGVDAEAGTMTFAGDVPEGALARLMRANPERLIDGAAAAAAAAAGGRGARWLSWSAASAGSGC